MAVELKSAVAEARAVRVFDIHVEGGAAAGAAAVDGPRSAITASDEGSALLRSFGTSPVTTVSVIGGAREGKSTLMNALLGVADVFKVSSSSETCTQGVHLSKTAPKWQDFAGEVWVPKDAREPVVAVIDSEGGGCKGEAYDMQIVTPTIILSNCVIVNLVCRPQPAAVADKLGTLAMAAARVTSALGDDDVAPPTHGHLHIAFRDYALEIDDPSKPAGSADAAVDFKAAPLRAGAVIRDWYLGLGAHTIKTVKAMWNKNRPASHNFAVSAKQQEQLESARTKIHDNFASVTVWLLPNAISSADAFAGHVAGMRTAIAQQLADVATSRTGHWTRRSTGSQLAALLPAIAEAVNTGAEELPIDSMFERAMKAEAKRVAKEAADGFAAAAETCSLSLGVGDLLASFNTLAAEAQACFTAALRLIGLSPAEAAAEAEDLKKGILELGQIDFRRRAALLAEAGAAFAARYPAATKAEADWVRANMAGTVAVDSTGRITVAGPAGTRLPQHGAEAELRKMIAAVHQGKLSALSSSGAAVLSVVLGPGAATAGDGAACGAAGSSSAAQVGLFEPAHAAALAGAAATIQSGMDADLRKCTDDALASLAAAFGEAAEMQRKAQAETLEAEKKRAEEAEKRAAEAAKRAAEAEERAEAAKRLDEGHARFVSETADLTAFLATLALSGRLGGRSALSDSDDSDDDVFGEREPRRSGGRGYSGGGSFGDYGGGGGYTSTSSSTAAPRTSTASTSSTASEGRYYKGGQFLPGGGRAPPGGTWR